VSYALSLVDLYGRKPSHNDYLALALAKQQDAALLTGDHDLKIVAQKESVQVIGTIWLLVAMVKHELLSVKKALVALKKNEATQSAASVG
jgi:predicted nucleic acid-binding protein